MSKANEVRKQYVEDAGKGPAIDNPYYYYIVDANGLNVIKLCTFDPNKTLLGVKFDCYKCLVGNKNYI